jgi:hypothetical protein
MRHRIHEYFSEERLQAIDDIRRSAKFKNNNERCDAILDVVNDMGVKFLGPGTNRMAFLLDGYVYKVAMDSFGVQDNWTEFNMSRELQPYVTKTYESNGLISIAEYVTLFTMEEFMRSKEVIIGILEDLAEDYLFCDISASTKSFANWGWRSNHDIVILDYGYIYPIDRRIMHCKKCGSPLVWNNNFTKLMCSKQTCKFSHDPIEIRDRMKKKETDFKHLEDLYEQYGEGPLRITVN